MYKNSKLKLKLNKQTPELSKRVDTAHFHKMLSQSGNKSGRADSKSGGNFNIPSPSISANAPLRNQLIKN